MRRKIFLLAALTALATFVIGGTASIAQGDALHPTCTWSVDKTASLHSNPGVPIDTLNLALNETVTVDYKIVVTRDCEAGFDPFAEGGSAGVADSNAPAGTFPDHLFLHSTNLHESATFTYSRDITATSCGSFDVVNTVEVLDGDPLHPFATDTNTIHVIVHCAGGCTLTQGYWKTHSSYGPASKPDATWNLLPGGLGPNTVFFLSGATWYTVFWTPPAGNAYYSLAHQYMAARLNILNGASAPSSVTAAITTATSLFATYTPAQIGALSGSDALRKQFVALAGTLGSYNEGLIGPGHCDE